MSKLIAAISLLEQNTENAEIVQVLQKLVSSPVATLITGQSFSDVTGAVQYMTSPAAKPALEKFSTYFNRLTSIPFLRNTMVNQVIKAISRLDLTDEQIVSIAEWSGYAGPMETAEDYVHMISEHGIPLIQNLVDFALDEGSGDAPRVVEALTTCPYCRQSFVHTLTEQL